MQKYDVIIIGAGLGGLSAGAALAKKGKRVCLIEQHSIPGGCATSFKRGDFSVEVGLHEMDGLDAYDVKLKVLQELGVMQTLEFIRLPEFYRFSHGRIDIAMPDETQEAITSLSEKFPLEKKGIEKFFDTIVTIRKEIFHLPSARWKVWLMLPVFPLFFPKLTKYKLHNVGDFLDSIIEDDDLKLLLLANLQYYHDDPYSMSLIYYSAAQASYFEGGGHYIKGGSQELSNALAGVIETYGGQLIYKHEVTEILIEKGNVVGVGYHKKRKSEKNYLYADTVIANAAVSNVISMLPQKQQEILGAKTDNLQASISLLTLYLGFDIKLEEVGSQHYSTFLFDKNVRTIKEIKESHRAPFDKRSFVFVDYSQIDSGLTPKGKSLGVIGTVDYINDWDGLDKDAYTQKKEEVTQILIHRLETLHPGIKEHIVYSELGTSKTIERYTMNPGGSVYGYAQTPKQSGMYRLGHKTGIKGLYLASAWSSPGGGFSGAILSGWFCAQEIL